MNIYLVSRYNADMFKDELSPDLECTKDSNLLVRANTHLRAIQLTNGYLATYLSAHPQFVECLKKGEELCHQIVQLGADTTGETEEVIHGPFLSHAIIKGKNVYPKWQFNSLEKIWEEFVD